LVGSIVRGRACGRFEECPEEGEAGRLDLHGEGPRRVGVEADSVLAKSEDRVMAPLRLENLRTSFYERFESGALGLMMFVLHGGVSSFLLSLDTLPLLYYCLFELVLMAMIEQKIP